MNLFARFKGLAARTVVLLATVTLLAGGLTGCPQGQVPPPASITLSYAPTFDGYELVSAEMSRTSEGKEVCGYTLSGFVRLEDGSRVFISGKAWYDPGVAAPDITITARQGLNQNYWWTGYGQVYGHPYFIGGAPYVWYGPYGRYVPVMAYYHPGVNWGGLSQAGLEVSVQLGDLENLEYGPVPAASWEFVPIVGQVGFEVEVEAFGCSTFGGELPVDGQTTISLPPVEIPAALKKYNISADTIGQGTVILDVLSHGGAQTKASFVEGTIIQLIASPATGWRFSHWEGDVDLADSVAGGALLATMTQDLEFTAVFVETGNGGGGNPDPDPVVSECLEGLLGAGEEVELPEALRYAVDVASPDGAEIGRRYFGVQTPTALIRDLGGLEHHPQALREALSEISEIHFSLVYPDGGCESFPVWIGGSYIRHHLNTIVGVKVQFLVLYTDSDEDDDEYTDGNFTLSEFFPVAAHPAS